MVGWLPTAELSFVCPDRREHPRVGLGSGEGGRKLLISPQQTAVLPAEGNSFPCRHKETGLCSRAGEAASSPTTAPRSPRSRARSGSRSFLGRNCCARRGSRQCPAPGALEHPLHTGGWLHICTPAALGGNSCDTILFWLVIRQHLVSGREGRKQRTGSALGSQRGLCLGCQTSERVGGIGREAKLRRAVGAGVQANGRAMEWRV